MIDPALHLIVHAGNDPRRTERLTDDLRDALDQDPELRSAGLSVADAAAAPTRPGRKGVLDTTAMLLVVGQYFARPAADVLIAAIQSWCARDRRVSVEIREGDRSITIVGSPTPEQQKAIERFHRSNEDHDRT